jgi:hypothetical protein
MLMAYFTNPTLSVAADDKTQTAQVTVSCDVHYSDEELGLLRDHPDRGYFSLFCILWGQDAGAIAPLDTDDWLFTFATRPLPAGPPQQVESVRLEETLGYNLLNEDVIGADEIYAELTLRGWLDFSDTAQRGRTATVRFDAPVKML